MPWKRPTTSSTARGYDAAHRRERARWRKIIDAEGADCSRCGRPIHPGQPFHLDHTADRTGYLGASHAACNVRAAAIEARRRQLNPIRRVRNW
jgi:hypothetical protein